MLNAITQLARELAEVHDGFERSDLIVPRLATRQGYVGVLRAMRSVHVAVEPLLETYRAAFAAHDVDLTERSKLHLLDAELATLNVPLGEPVIALTVTINGLPHAWGALYVLEGSTLGGAYLAKEVERRLAVRPCYYGCYGSATRAMWTSFGAGLNNYVAAMPEVFDAVLAGARGCYQTCIEALSAG